MLRLLLVEDDACIAEGVQEWFMLAHADKYDILCLQRGDDAEKIVAKAHDFQCVLLDLSLLGASGTEVLQTLRNWDKTTPVIITTASEVKKAGPECFDLGANEVMGKPYDMNELHNTIQRLVASFSNTGVD